MPIINGKTYSKYRQDGSRTEYRGPGHTDLDDDVLIMQTTDPTRNKSTYGNRRSGLTLVQGISTVAPGCSEAVLNNMNASFKLTASVPAGSTAAEIDALIGDFQAAVADGVLIKALFVNGQHDQ